MWVVVQKSRSVTDVTRDLLGYSIMAVGHILMLIRKTVRFIEASVVGVAMVRWYKTHEYACPPTVLRSCTSIASRMPRSDMFATMKTVLKDLLVLITGRQDYSRCMEH
jgi:hypothetical protein